ncbi:MAG: 1-deoxy-D-xylulose-5-phosphate reductoisomerase [Chlamydiales bacterium]|nr:1-deoxy-D-xylulose-5-phosphate reductoisomerase [Chlamydiales bacterium]
MKKDGFPKRIAVLGSTGSIGKNTLKVVRHLFPKVQIRALAAKSQIDLLQEQAQEFYPELIAVYDKDKALELQRRLPYIRVVGGMEGLLEAASLNSVDLVVSAITGTLGIQPTVQAINCGKDVALANKEALVSAGEYIMELVRKKGVQLIPIDSEHSALFQCLRKEKREHVRRVIVTASGGPFLHTKPEELAKMGAEQALAHPTWRMGPKNSIDSSTLMNKGFEVIEAHFLFGIPVDKIDVVIHPQSTIHSMIEMIDGSMLAQLSETDMALPIQYALTYPERLEGFLRPFDFSKAFSLQFFPPDHTKFPCLQLGYEAIRQGGSMPCYLNAANEILVSRFLQGAFGWQEIGHKLEQLLSSHQVESSPSLETILEIDELAKEQALKI